MANQTGIIRVEGTIDNITFYKDASGYKIRRKGGVSADRIARDPKFEMTRQNGLEFARAGKAGRLLRNALGKELKGTTDSKMVSRLTSVFMKVIQADQSNGRGLRNVLDGEVELLTGFDFNVAASFNNAFFAPYTATIDRNSGQAKVEMPAFTPRDVLKSPQEATHFEIISTAIEIDFENETYVVDKKNSGELKLDEITNAINLSCQLTPASTHPLLLVLGVEYSLYVNNVKEKFKGSAFNSRAIVKVSGV